MLQPIHDSFDPDGMILGFQFFGLPVSRAGVAIEGKQENKDRDRATPGTEHSLHRKSSFPVVLQWIDFPASRIDVPCSNIAV
jgi:hypothetical protein